MNDTPLKTSLAYSKLVGIPYDKKNCWDIAVDFYLDVFGVHLKHYYLNGVPQDRPETKDLIYSNIGDFEKVEGDPKFGDVILFRIHGIESHIGIFLDKGKFLHSSKRTGSVIDQLARWNRLIVGFYRLKELK